MEHGSEITGQKFISDHLQKVKDFISSNCQRTKPSARDALKLKDILLLVNSIIHNKPITTLEA